jgi:hypothetical protein
LAVFASDSRIFAHVSNPLFVSSAEMAISRTLRISFAAALAFAKAMAPERRSPSTMSSIMPAVLARGAANGLPSVHIWSASSAPARRGSRCVPPAPGMIPRSTSGWPTFASRAATRK